MVDDALAHFARPDFAIIGEPTTMQLVRAHKSINQAYQPNEFIDPAELKRCEAMVDDVFDYLCRSSGVE